MVNVFHPPKQVFFYEHPKLSTLVPGISRVNGSFYLHCMKIKRLHRIPRSLLKLILLKGNQKVFSATFSLLTLNRLMKQMKAFTGTC